MGGGAAATERGDRFGIWIGTAGMGRGGTLPMGRAGGFCIGLGGTWTLGAIRGTLAGLVGRAYIGGIGAGLCGCGACAGTG